MTDKQKSEITGLRAAGDGYTVIARKMGLPRDTVRGFCRGMPEGPAAAGGHEKKSVLLQGVPGEVVARPSGPDKAEGSLFLYLRRVRAAVHGLRQRRAEILLP